MWITKHNRTYKARAFTAVKTIANVALLIMSCVTGAICVCSEAHAPTHFRVDVDMAAQTCGNLVNDRQSQAGTGPPAAKRA